MHWFGWVIVSFLVGFVVGFVAAYGMIDEEKM